VACLPDGSLVCAWASGCGKAALDTSIEFSRKPAGARRWTPPVTIADDVGYPDGHPVLAQMPEGELRLFYATQYRDKRKVPPGTELGSWHLKYSDSVDGGRTWCEGFFLVPESDWLPCAGLVNLTGGGLLLPATDVRDCVSLFLFSEDEGGYWEDLTRPSRLPGLVDPSVVPLRPGHLIALLRPHESGKREHSLWRAESSDNGRTWSVPQQTTLPNPGAPAALLKLANGHLVLAYNDHPLWLTPLTLAVSRNGGKTWQSKRNLESGKWDIRAPSLVQTRDGHIHVVYVSRNTRIKHIETAESWIVEGQ
jgi:predicted neuraminidase